MPLPNKKSVAKNCGAADSAAKNFAAADSKIYSHKLRRCRFKNWQPETVSLPIQKLAAMVASFRFYFFFFF
jgi:hypothetical protein